GLAPHLPARSPLVIDSPSRVTPASHRLCPTCFESLTRQAYGALCQAMRRYKVILADDHSLVRSGLRRELEGSGDVQIVAEAATGAQLLCALEDHACQLVVVDLAMPEM